MGIRKMQGTSSFLEYIGPKEKKLNRYCIHYKNKCCMCKSSQTYLSKCVGRVNCGKYDDRIEKKLEIEKDNEEIINYKLNTNNIQGSEKKSKKASKKNNQNKVNCKGTIYLEDKHHYLLGKTIKLRSLKVQEDITIKIVTPDKVSKLYRRYSLDSSFARALAGKKIGDTIRVDVVNGFLAYKVLSIE